MNTRSFLTTLGLAFGLGLAVNPSFAQNYPARPVRMVVPLPAGTATDMAARMLGQQLGAALGQPFMIDNKPGANSVIGVMDVLRAPPDGYTLLLAAISPLAANVALVKNMPYDPQRDLTPVGGFGQTMHALVVKANHPARTLAEIVAYAKKNPGKISVGSSTSSTQVQIATFNKLTGLDMLTIPYKGVPATVTDLMGGSLDIAWVDLSNAIAQTKGGNLRALAVTSAKRNPLVPDWPAVAETVPDFDFTAWLAVVGPAGLPRDVADQLSAAIAQVLQQPKVKEQLASIGMTPMPLSPSQLKSFMASEISKWIVLAKQANVEPE
jgi:tripartite-type tricarboxylate transporter receptor subunit TctC